MEDRVEGGGEGEGGMEVEGEDGTEDRVEVVEEGSGRVGMEEREGEWSLET